MAIDFGRMARGIATGYLGAKIANTEANDRLKEDIIRQSGENFYNNTLPEFQKREKNNCLLIVEFRLCMAMLRGYIKTIII